MGCHGAFGLEETMFFDLSVVFLSFTGSNFGEYFRKSELAHIHNLLPTYYIGNSINRLLMNNHQDMDCLNL